MEEAARKQRPEWAARERAEKLGKAAAMRAAAEGRVAAQAVRVVVADSQPVAQEEAAEEAQLGVRLEAVARVRGREETESEPHEEPVAEEEAAQAASAVGGQGVAEGCVGGGAPQEVVARTQHAVWAVAAVVVTVGQLVGKAEEEGLEAAAGAAKAQSAAADGRQHAALVAAGSSVAAEAADVKAGSKEVEARSQLVAWAAVVEAPVVAGTEVSGEQAVVAKEVAGHSAEADGRPPVEEVAVGAEEVAAVQGA